MGDAGGEALSCERCGFFLVVDRASTGSCAGQHQRKSVVLRHTRLHRRWLPGVFPSALCCRGSRRWPSEPRASAMETCPCAETSLPWLRRLRRDHIIVLRLLLHVISSGAAHG